MSRNTLVISKGTLQQNDLGDKVVLLTGGGGGIGYEAARSFLWLGAKVIIAEINKEKGSKAEKNLKNEFGNKNVVFIETDLTSDRSVARLAKKAKKTFGVVDIILNNATVTPIGSVEEVGIRNWDLSYRTNLRGPILLINHFLPEMKKRNSGIIVLVSSSGAAPYMGAYEVFKTAQVELANTLAAELEDTGIFTYTIGPGLVKTDTAQKAIEKIAPLYGKTIEEFYQMSKNALLSVEEAGAGFAASVALADKYCGLETSSIQILKDIGISIHLDMLNKKINITNEEKTELLKMYSEIKMTFIEQVDGWKNRPYFERQWVLRDFKKHMGAVPEQFIDKLNDFEQMIKKNQLPVDEVESLIVEKIYSYYEHQMKLLKGYEKNQEKITEYSDIMKTWFESIEKLSSMLKKVQANKVEKDSN